ncbi:MAG: outer membrane protein assembly factor BamC [Methylococcales bacterium]
MINSIMRAGFFAWLMLLSSCSFFPDKEKQYLQSSELAALQLPPDLQKEVDSNLSDTVQNNVTQQDQQVATSDDSADYSEENNNRMPMLVDVVKQPIHIEFFDGYDKTWRTVGKVLAHMGLEVLDRDEENGQYYIVYEEDSEPVEESIWSFLAFWRDENQHEEYDFRVKLFADEGTTRVLILDSDEQPVVEGPGRKLLAKIYQAL